MDAWVPVALAEDGPDRQVLKAEPVEGHSKVLVHVVRVPENVDRDSLAGTLEGIRRIRHPQVLRILMDGWIGPQSLIVVTPSLGATPWATRLVTRPPSLVESVRVIAQVAHGLHAVHTHGRVYGPLTPEHVLVVPGPTGWDEACLLPTWWSWRYGFSMAEARSWQPPEVIGRTESEWATEDRSSDAWRLGAVAWHSLTGSPPPEGAGKPGTLLPTLTATVRAAVPEGLEAVVAALLHADPRVRPVDMGRVAERLEEVVHHLEGGGPMIGPPMVTATPIPFGGQLRERSLVLPVPPPAPRPPPPSPPTPAVPPMPAVPPTAAVLPTPVIEEHGATPATQRTRAEAATLMPLLGEEPGDTLDLPSPQPIARVVPTSSPVADPLPAPTSAWRVVGPIVASAGLAAVAVLLVLYLAGLLG
jgi:hypothetical protein